MGLLAAIRSGTASDDPAGSADAPARCRSCGRYYDAAAETCPHCGSGNKLRGGPPVGQTRR